jgi:4-aminobutyrate aminotransferase-like enzyme
MTETKTAPMMVNAFDPANANGLSAAEQSILERRARMLGSAYRLFYRRPVHFVRGEGVWLYDADGEAYLDVYNNVASVGHCHPHVVAALSRQAATLNTHTRYLDESILNYSERLLTTMPDEIGRVMFTCTGSESNDLAFRIAQTVTGGEGIVVTETAYHGVTNAVSAFSPSLGPGVPLGGHVRTVAPPDHYRFGGNAGAKFAESVGAAFADLKRHGIKPAAIYCDTIFSSDGVFAEPAGFLRDVVEATHAAGALFVADEVQAGFGRTGAGMWGFARHGVVPDIVTTGKPMGNGHPIGGVFAKADIIDAFGRSARYFNTFGGNPVSCEVGMAVLDVIENEKLIDNARDVGGYLKAGLEALATSVPAIGDVRGSGLFIGVELVKPHSDKVPDAELASRIVNDLRDRRILISATGPHANVLKVRPPLVFGKGECDILLGALTELLAG